MLSRVSKLQMVRIILSQGLSILITRMLLKSALAVNTYMSDEISPYDGITVKVHGVARSVIISKETIGAGRFNSVLLHELMHVAGGNEYTCELLDLLTGGSKYTPSDNLSKSELAILNEYSN